MPLGNPDICRIWEALEMTEKQAGIHEGRMPVQWLFEDDGGLAKQLGKLAMIWR